MTLMSENRAQVPVVVVGAAGACGLGVIRSLSQANLPITLVDDNRYAPAMHSRFGHKLVISRLAGPALIRDLLALATQMPSPPVLFLTRDESMLTISEHRDELAMSYRFTLPSHHCLTSLAHKTTFQELAESLGFPVPRSVRIRSEADVASVAELQFPVVAKPAIKTAEYVCGNLARAYKVSSSEEAKAKCRLMLTAVPELVVQEWITGLDSELYFCFIYLAADGSTLCSFVGRKLSIWPPDVGVTASCTAAPELRDVLLPLTEAFFRRVSFVGMGGIEFKKDARTGRFLMIEPTVGRVDAQEEVATIHGVNIPLVAYLHEAGLPVPAMHTNSLPVVWRDTWPHRRAARRNPAPHVDTRPLKVCDAYWRINDPVPALVHFLAGSIRSLGRYFTATPSRMKVQALRLPFLRLR
jgi:D-aspartate ligase